MLSIEKIEELKTRLLDEENWSPKVKKIAQEMNLPISTIWDNIRRLRLSDNIRIGVSIQNKNQLNGGGNDGKRTGDYAATTEGSA